jgi:DNA polymerase III subunit epsilon
MTKRHAVFDVETTGFGYKDSILEIGIVLLDDDEIVLEWETLINPNRDISNSEIHGINPSHLSTAPYFSDVANDIASLLSDRILVAHNLPFDQRMLTNEYSKLEIGIDPGKGICTYNATKMKLEVACKTYGIKNADSHRALADARATAILLSRAGIDANNAVPAKIQHSVGKPFSRTISRSAFENHEFKKASRIRRIMHSLDVPSGNSAQMSYMDALTSALSDLHLDVIEKESLGEWAQYLGLNSLQIREMHELYLNEFVAAAKRDGLVTKDEQSQIDSLSRLLGVEIQVESNGITNFKMANGLRICFTGSARNADGVDISREDLEGIAKKRGLIPVDSVTKKGCDVVVAADVNSMSTKARKAKEWGIPVISVNDFLKES